MGRSPSWEANRFAASQEIPRVLLNTKVHYRIHKCPPPVSVPSQPNSVHNPIFYLLNNHLLSSQLCQGLPNCLFPSGFPIKTLYTPLPSPYALRATPISFSIFFHPRNSEWGAQFIKLLVWSFLHSPVTSTLLGQNDILNTLFSNAHNLHSSLNSSDQVSHVYKTTGNLPKISVTYHKRSSDSVMT
jgi:hypothetical protein